MKLEQKYLEKPADLDEMSPSHVKRLLAQTLKRNPYDDDYR